MPARKPRKYNIKPYQKKLITDDIKEAKGDIATIEKKIKRRFGNEDPQASFIVRYLSPIMATAADRVHLSEEMKAFCEEEKENGKIGNDEHMFGRFWKHNPHILNYYAQTITDTIDLFEEIYGDGGLIPINRDLEIIKPETENKTAIDKVNTEFLELLDFTQTILPDREKRYAEHDRLQAEWNEHFINRYGIPSENVSKTETIDKPQKIEPDNKELDINKLFLNALKEECRIYPNEYASKYMRFMLNNKDLDDEYKTAYAYYIGENDIEDKVKLSADEFYERFHDAETKFINKNAQDSTIAKFAILDLLTKNNYRDYTLYNLNTFDLPNIEISKDNIYPIIEKHKDELNKLYDEYHKLPKRTEIKQTVEELAKRIANYNKKPEANDAPNVNAILSMFKDASKTKLRERQIREFLNIITKRYYPYTKLILDKDFSEQEQMARFENIMLPIIMDLIFDKGDLILQMIGKENFERYVHELTPNIKMTLVQKTVQLQLGKKNFYELKDSEIRNNPAYDNMDFEITIH